MKFEDKLDSLIKISNIEEDRKFQEKIKTIKNMEKIIRQEIKEKSYDDLHSIFMGIIIKKLGFSKDKYFRGWDEYEDFLFNTGFWNEELEIYALIQTGHFSTQYQQEYIELKFYDSYQSDLKAIDWTHERGSVIVYEEVGEESEIIELIDNYNL
ncbi:hypothetical protein NE686_17640 [Tissierella carlieri]|uniref:DUF4240 domain-containing protein n=1 Tax=Tissierella carlieri TaxID=689904 RepID=A0ABT1SET5_9FIRM|nr:hypothetical protein [Tissierella carlieri]MCQ4924929.1 hypothetical protein [Tissierella carlieri]